MINHKVVHKYLRSFHVFDPLERLTLWINHQRPALAASHYDTILCREPITRQTLNVPVANPRRVHHEVTELKLLTDWNDELFELTDPNVINEFLAIACQERPHVGQECRRDQNVADQEAESFFQVLQQTTSSV